MLNERTGFSPTFHKGKSLTPPFGKGGLGGISQGLSNTSGPEFFEVCKIPPNPPFPKGGTDLVFCSGTYNV
jgi:hypothetical protein